MYIYEKLNRTNNLYRPADMMEYEMRMRQRTANVRVRPDIRGRIKKKTYGFELRAFWQKESDSRSLGMFEKNYKVRSMKFWCIQNTNNYRYDQSSNTHLRAHKANRVYFYRRTSSSNIQSEPWDLTWMDWMCSFRTSGSTSSNINTCGLWSNRWTPVDIAYWKCPRVRGKRCVCCRWLPRTNLRIPVRVN